MHASGNSGALLRRSARSGAAAARSARLDPPLQRVHPQRQHPIISLTAGAAGGSSEASTSGSGAAAAATAPPPAAAAAAGGAAAAAAATAAGAAAAPGGGKPRQRMAVHFITEGVTTEAASGDVIMEVAAAAGITIPGGCYSGNCGICEVEVRKLKAGEERSAAGAAVVRSCVARLPPGYERVEVDYLADDQIWGLDGFDT